MDLVPEDCLQPVALPTREKMPGFLRIDSSPPHSNASAKTSAPA